MSDYSQGPGWWQASDGKWYPPDSAAPDPAPAAAVAPAPAPGPFTAPAPGVPVYGGPIQPKKSNGMAIAAMVCGIVGLVIGLLSCGFGAPGTLILGIVAAILGHKALGQIKEDPAQEGSKNFAMTGVITGWIAVALGLIVTVIFVIIAVTADNTDFDNNDFDGFCNEDAFFDPDCD